MNKEDKKLREDLVNEMMKVYETNPDVIIYIHSLMKCYENLEKENQQLKKQKDDVVEYIKHKMSIKENYMIYGDVGTELLRMLGEIE